MSPEMRKLSVFLVGVGLLSGVSYTAAQSQQTAQQLAQTKAKIAEVKQDMISHKRAAKQQVVKIPSVYLKMRQKAARVIDAQMALTKITQTAAEQHQQVNRRNTDYQKATGILELYVDGSGSSWAPQTSVWGGLSSWKMVMYPGPINSGGQYSVTFAITDDKGQLMAAVDGDYDTGLGKFTNLRRFTTTAGNQAQVAWDAKNRKPETNEAGTKG